MIAIRGSGSAIARALMGMLPADEPVTLARRSYGNDPAGMPYRPPLPLDADRYVFCEGAAQPAGTERMQIAEGATVWQVNYALIARDVEAILDANDRARICVIGSESGISGSFDLAYAGSKAALHRYVETRRLRTPDQQLVCVAPTVVGDAGMTTRRRDQDQLAERARRHPKGRWLRATEVARMVKYLLYDDLGYITGTVIRMHGGPA